MDVHQQAKLLEMDVHQQAKLLEMDVPQQAKLLEMDVHQQAKLLEIDVHQQAKLLEMDVHQQANTSLISASSADSCGALKQVSLPPDLKEGGNLEVIVTEVTSPSDFWIQLRAEESSWNLEGLMDEMEEFYGRHGDLYRLNDEQCVPGAIIASPYSTIGYHRARIEEIKEDNIKVFYVDYGTIGHVEVGDLRLLHRKFSHLPAQALEAKLWGVASPSGSEVWPEVAIKSFYEMVTAGSRAGGCFSAVKKIKGGVLYLELYDTVTNDRPEGININLELIKEGLAVKDINVSVFIDEENNEIKEVSPEDLEFLASVDEELSGAKISHLRPLILPNNTVHLINFQGKAWMTSCQISSLIPNWHGRDLLERMVAIRKIPVDAEDITAEQNSDLFTQLSEAGLTPKNDGASGVHTFRLYLLNSVPSLLDMFSVEKDRPLRLAIMTTSQQFDPADKFWWLGTE